MHLLVTVLTGLLSLQAGAAPKGPPAVRLVYARAPGAERCPDEAAVRSAVAARLGIDPFREPAELIVSATITAHAGTFRARLDVSTPSGKSKGVRELSSRSSDCAELASAMDLAISIAIDPLALVPKPAPEPAPPAPAPVREPPPPARCPEPAPCPACPAPAPPPAEPPKGLSIDWLASLGAQANFGTAPGPAFGAKLGVEARFSAFQVGIEGRGDFDSSTDVAGGRVGTSLVVLSVAPCWRYRWLGLCAVVSAGALRSSAEGLPGARQATTPYVAAGGRILADFNLIGPLFLRVEAELRANLVRTSIDAAETPVWSTPALSGGGGVGAVVRFL